jgi:hypothetical protein
MMEAAITSETLVNLYQSTQRNNPQDSHLHTRRRENLKSQGPVWMNIEEFRHFFIKLSDIKLN